jgi:phosphopantothenoylcysteine synthetase/decarboxylase
MHPMAKKKPVRILVTAGGSKVRLDDVRWLGNVSTGRFGGAVAVAALRQGCETVELLAADALTPFQHVIDLAARRPARAALAAREAEALRPHFRSFRFTTYDQYARRLHRLIAAVRFDIVILAAAISDYGPESVAGKISSDRDELSLRLKRLPKVIDQVRERAPDAYLVGFKLTAGLAAQETIAVAEKAMQSHRADLVVANDLATLRQGRHTIHLVRQGAPVETYAADEQTDPAAKLVERVLAWREERAR